MDPFWQAFTVALIFFALLLILPRVLRRWARNRARELGLPTDDSVYSMLNTTRAIMKRMETQGLRVSDAREHLAAAERYYREKRYKLAADYCEMAKRSLYNARKSAPVVGMAVEETPTLARPAESKPAEITAKIREGIPGPMADGDETMGDKRSPGKKPIDYVEEEEDGGTEMRVEEVEAAKRSAEEALRKRNNKLPAKFMISTARDAIDSARDRGDLEGDDLAEAEETYSRARKAFDDGKYSRALSLANRAKKLALGEPLEPANPPPPAREGETASRDIAEESGGGGTTAVEPDVKISGETYTFPCPECGAAVPEDAESCPECGVLFVQTLLCPECGGEVEDGDVFCRHCGARLVVEVVEKECASCGETIPGDSVFCPRCGARQE
ncbi:MAG: zinc ribbon domain-containing protein [Thermoplasmata archaeon]|nr:zinc ribbon domain-containing protein [Thermoplasmata archaeon]